MTQPRRRSGRFDGLLERIGTVLGVAFVVLFVGFTLVLRFRGTATGGPPRTPAEQRAMLAGGDCALAPNHALVGKLVVPLAASRSRPHGGYELEAVDRRRVFQVDAGEVTLVPCASLAR